MYEQLLSEAEAVAGAGGGGGGALITGNVFRSLIIIYLFIYEHLRVFADSENSL